MCGSSKSNAKHEQNYAVQVTPLDIYLHRLGDNAGKHIADRHRYTAHGVPNSNTPPQLEEDDLLHGTLVVCGWNVY